ncbi:MAG: trypsin-like peptidase domain-containing protein [Fimbriimonas sp.]|nr:trypsin-like peptidase domain-containing protein [Fimbriimonas sp.]
MNQNPHTPKSVYVTLGAGFVLGAVFMAGIYGKGFMPFSKALASDNHLPSFQARTISAPSRESVSEVRNLDAFYTNLAEFVSPAVVDIQSTSGRQVGPNGERMPVSGGEGSGFILRPDGYIVTNDHVVGGFEKVKVILKDGREFDGKVTRAHDSDIAIVKIDAKNLPTLAFADSSKLKPGQMAMAIGAPFGLEQSVTFGHVSALGRDKTVIENRYYPDMIQTDTAINMGNSGGPLTNIDGQVIGLNTAIYSPSGTSAGIGFAIPSNQVRLIVDKLIENGKVVRSQIGLIPENLTEYQKQQRHVTGGALVADAPENQPAGMAGIKKDDVVVRVGHTSINTQLDLRNAMLEYAPGTSVAVEVIRNGVHKTYNVKLQEHKAEAEQQPMGGQMSPQPFQFRFPKGLDEAPDFFKDFPGFTNPHARTQPSTPANPDGKAHLGVTVNNLTDDVRQQFSIPSDVHGAVVGQVNTGSVAESVGLQPGDVIEMLGNKQINSADDLISAMSGVKPGESKRIKFARFGKNSTIQSELDVTF